MFFPVNRNIIAYFYLREVESLIQNMHMRRLELAIFFIILSINLYANTGTELYSNLRFNSFSTHEGLSQSSVLSITQDHNGFIWMGTKNGLNRFDGYNFQTYKNQIRDSSSVSNNEIIFLNSDSNGNIFIGTRGGGLNLYLKDENRFIRYPDTKTPDGTVTSVYECPGGEIWVGTSEGLLHGIPMPENDYAYRFTNVSHKAVYYNENERIMPFNSAALSVVSIFQFANNHFLIGTFQGLFIFDQKEMTFSKVDIGEHNFSKINAIKSDPDNNIWIAGSEGLVCLSLDNEEIGAIIYNSLQSNEWNKLNTNWVETLLFDFNGNLWAGTRGAGVVMLTPEGSISNYSNDITLSNRVGDNIINSMMIDDAGILWIGTESRGVVTLDLHRKRFNHLENNSETGRNLTSNLVTAIAGNGNSIWVGTAYNGLDHLHFNNDNTITTQHFNQIPSGYNSQSSEIISLLLDHDNTMWIGTASNNLVRYKPGEGFGYIPIGAFAFSLHQDRGNTIWVGTWGNGLAYLNDTTNEVINISSTPPEPRSISGDIILSMFDDNRGNFWIGTKGRGLNVIPLEQLKNGYKHFVSFEKNDNLLHNDIYCIFQDSDDVLWIGTGGGLSKLDLYSNPQAITELYNGNANFVTYTEDDGLPANLIYGIVEDQKGNLWISTTKGLSKFDRQNNTFQNYSANDGLQSNEFHSNAFYASPNNMLFFGGVNGLSFFNPEEIQPDERPLEVVLSGLKVANMPVKPLEKVKGKIILNTDISNAEKITLNHKHKDFSIEFSALHFNYLQGVTYAYRLLGFHDEWRYLPGNEHSVSYTNLWEGEYLLQIKATNNDGIWNENPRELKIKVLPPYWRSLWFYAIYVVVLILGLLLFRRYTLIGVAEKNKLLIEHIERNSLIENTEAKMRFFTNISHEIRTPLTLISNPLDEVINNTAIDEKSRSNLQLVAKNVNRLLHLTNQLLQLRRIDKGGVDPNYSKVNLAVFVKEIISYFLQKALNKEITLSFHSDIEAEDEIWIDPELITTAVYNLISNAYKFTPSKGHINIKIHKEAETLSRFDKLKGKKADNKKWYCIEVSDTGIGIPAEDIPNIFHRFYQSKNKKSRETAGSGIGLSIVKEYIDLHQGKIETKSKINEGTTFKIMLPSGNEHVKNKNISKNNEDYSQLNTVKRIESEAQEQIVQAVNPKNLPVILLVEDDDDLNKYIAQSLSENYIIHTANNGKRGIEKAYQIKPDLIISDIMMPETDGLVLCNELKNNEETQHIPIILLTAKASDENKIDGYQSGADLYVSKPFRNEVLKSQIEQLLKTRKILSEVFSKQIFLKPRDIIISSADEKFLTRMNDIIDKNLADPNFDVAAMVEHMNQSHSTVLKKIKILTGMSLVEFVKTHRLKRAAQILEKDSFQVAEVAYLVGFSDPKYFSKCFSKEFGKTPTEYVHENRKSKK